MKEQSPDKSTFAGTCVFCKAEVAKNKMTQHLKFCKERQATIAAQEKQASGPKTRLFHILAEGQYKEYGVRLRKTLRRTRSALMICFGQKSALDIPFILISAYWHKG